MSWISDNNLCPLKKMAIALFKTGKIPYHIAFIMDGNRRFANKNRVIKIEGHNKGFDKLTEVLKWCLDLGVSEVTVYAFSIENFKRSSEEVDQLMDLARQKFKHLLSEKDKLMKEGVNIRVIGNLSLLPKDLYKLISEAVYMTKNNKRVRLTVAFSYTGRNEIAESIKSISKGVKDGMIEEKDITSKLLSRSLYTEDSIVPDLIIRTSGEVRISDFMLWQSSCSYLYFTTKLWPEFTLWELLKGIFYYQRSYDALNKIRKSECETFTTEKAEYFLTELHLCRINKMKEVVC